ncbi:hypothetical protein JKG47_05335 [Acidithiobacillus sp. MC6.1]|nr:hypothetical protein [Acidithiobacillus sp. MC6.1]
MKTSETSLLAEKLRTGGFTLTAEGSRLRVAPADLLSDELREEIRQHRAALLSLVANEAPESAPAVRSTTDLTPPPSVRPEQDMATQRASCGQCLHFLPDTINPAQGVGTCKATTTGLPPPGNGYRAAFPRAPRTCPSYQPLEES